MRNDTRCPSCEAKVNWAMDRCPKCKHDMGFPNIREVGCSNELDKLDSRHRKALDDAAKNNAQDRVSAFEKVLASQSSAVINCSPSFLAGFLEDNRILYSTYKLQVDAETRKAASMNDDRQRHGTEGTLFGSYAGDICYAALSLDGAGLVSNGPCSVTISETTCEASATLLEENSYTFVRNRNILPGDDIPLGYRALWRDRHKLAVAKLAHKVTPGTQDHTFKHLLLESDGNKENDEFLEIHLYGPFDNQSIDAVSAPRPENAPNKEKNDLRRIRDQITKSGKQWMEQ
ncbi:MAG TPA: hypothetical protein ENI69_03475 [Rhodospirillales bacterium]|nr:hypothetical protein [Rhodospirillales bacterium]